MYTGAPLYSKPCHTQRLKNPYAIAGFTALVADAIYCGLIEKSWAVCVGGAGVRGGGARVVFLSRTYDCLDTAGVPWCLAYACITWTVQKVFLQTDPQAFS